MFLQLNKFLLFSLFFVVFGCGFQLRGKNNPLPERFSATYLDVLSTRDLVLNAQLRRLFYANKGKLVDKEFAKTRVHITPIRESKRQIAISGDGFLKEYESTFSFTVSVYDVKSNVLLGKRELSTVRYTQLDDRQILSSEEQNDIVLSQAIKDLSYQVVSYLSSFN